MDMFENDFRFDAMTSEALTNKAPAGFNWSHFYSTFERKSLTPRELAVSIWRGYSFTPVWHTARREANFVSAGHMAFDFDAGDETSSLDYIMRDGTFAWMFASFAYTTVSHTEAEPRARAVFILEQPVTSPVEYRRIYQAVAWWIATSDGSACDPACKDPLRLYYGSKGATLKTNWSILAVPTIDYITAQYDAAHPVIVQPSPVETRVPLAPSPSLQNAKLEQLGRKVKDAPRGEGHNALIRAATVAGGYVASGALNPADVEAELEAAAMSRPEPDRKEIQRTIRDGLTYGATRPLHFEGVKKVGDILP